MTNPPHDGEGREDGAGGPQPERDQHLTQPVHYDRPPPSPWPAPGPQYGAPPAGRPQGNAPAGYGPREPQNYGRPHQQYGPPDQQYGPPNPQPWQQAPPPHGAPGYGPPPGQYVPPGYGPTPYPPPGPVAGHSPQYGMPGPYGPPYPGVPRKPRTGLIAALVVLGLVLVLALVAGLALRSTVLDPAAVERDVAAQFEEREGVAVDLSCEEEMEVEEGESYPCRGVTADGEEVELQITVTDEDTGAYTWTEP